MEETFKQWSKTPQHVFGLGIYAEILVTGGSFFFESYINLTAFLSSQNSCLPLHFWGSTLDAPDETFEASSFYFIGWLIEWQTSKTRVETVDFQHLHMNWWVLFISNSHVMPTDLWWTCDVSTGAEWKVGILQVGTPKAWRLYVGRRCCEPGNGRLKSCAGSQLGCERCLENCDVIMPSAWQAENAECLWNDISRLDIIQVCTLDAWLEEVSSFLCLCVPLHLPIGNATCQVAVEGHGDVLLKSENLQVAHVVNWNDQRRSTSEPKFFKPNNLTKVSSFRISVPAGLAETWLVPWTARVLLFLACIATTTWPLEASATLWTSTIRAQWSRGL